MDFQFTRTHSNQSNYIGPLGNKWDHNYNLRIRLTPDHNVIYRSTGRASETAYRRHTIYGYWLAEGGEDGIITQIVDGFLWRSSNGLEFYYTQQHSRFSEIFLIKKIQDRFGNNLTFEYNDNFLIKVFVNHNERYITFRPDSNNNIIAITDFSGRRWNYTYDDFNDLIAVTTPTTVQYKYGLMTRYEYTTAALI